MRGPFFISLGLHVLVGLGMVWASGASEMTRALPTATVVKLIRPGMMPISGRLGQPPKGREDRPPDVKPDKPTSEELKPPVADGKQPMALPQDKKKKGAEDLASNAETKPKMPDSRVPNTTGGGSSKELVGDAGTLRVSGSGFEYDFYLATVQSKIEQNFRPPPGVRAQSLATIAFSIQKNGQISNIGLAHSSGNLLIDQAAERAIRAAGRFPPLPPQYAQGQLDINFEFVINPHAKSN